MFENTKIAMLVFAIRLKFFFVLLLSLEFKINENKSEFLLVEIVGSIKDNNYWLTHPPISGKRR